MRRWILVGCVGLAVASCSQQPPAQLAGDGQLVLELGGGSKSLAASLQALGVELLPPRERPQVPPPTPVDATDVRGNGAPAEGPGGNGDARKAEPAPKAGVAPPASPDWFEVELAPRQTLMDLAHKHLGSGLRFKELLTLNGFTEKDARRLKVGQKIKIPKAAPR